MIVTPERIQKLIAADHFGRGRDQGLQNVEVLACKVMNGATRVRDGSGAQIHSTVSDAKKSNSLRRRVRYREYLAHTDQQFTKMKWFWDVIRGAKLKAAQALFSFVSGSHEQEWDPRLKFRGEIKAASIRKLDIDDRQRRIRAPRIPRLPQGGAEDDGESFRFESIPECFAENRIVLDD